MAQKDKINPNAEKPLTRREFIAGSASALAVASLPLAQSANVQQQQQSKLPSAPAVSSPFGADFLWGAATSAYQIEGGSREDGKELSVWDEFVRQPGVIRDGNTGDMACDFYHTYAADIGHMHEMGLKAFCFSVAWSRVIPQGTGDVNQKGLDFYSQVVDTLLAAGITPIVTLFHWDTPLALVQRGGWETRDIAGWFGDYAATVARSLSDRVKYWLTITEPRSFIGGGYVTGVQAPGEKLPRDQFMRAAHITLMAHGRAVQAVRANAKKPVHIGCPCDVSPSLPESPSAADITAAQNSTFASPIEHFSAEFWWRENSWWLDPIYTGTYPSDAIAALGKDAPEIEPGDMGTIHQPLDFLAANIYGGWPVRANPQGVPQIVAFPPGYPETAFGWQVTPDAMYWAPKWLYDRYKLPIFVTENGCSCRDWISLDGQVHDPQRIDFAQRYLQSLARAMKENVPTIGYLHWSLLDNFEWQEGYSQRFGMIFVDFPTQKRILKDSARWYAKVISSQGGELLQPSPAQVKS